MRNSGQGAFFSQMFGPYTYTFNLAAGGTRQLLFYLEDVKDNTGVTGTWQLLLYGSSDGDGISSTFTISYTGGASDVKFQMLNDTGSWVASLVEDDVTVWSVDYGTGDVLDDTNTVAAMEAAIDALSDYSCSTSFSGHPSRLGRVILDVPVDSTYRRFDSYELQSFNYVTIVTGKQE